MITGSPRGAYDEDGWVLRLGDFIRAAYKAGGKLVGICFGHQILAQALGGRSEKSARGWGLGWRSFEIKRQKPWMTNAPDTCSLYFAHQDQAVRLPPNAELLGENAFCANAMFSIGSQVLGIQGHPEFTAGEMGDIFQALEDVVDRRVFEGAVKSMVGHRPDNQLLARWIINFLKASNPGV